MTLSNEFLIITKYALTCKKELNMKNMQEINVFLLVL